MNLVDLIQKDLIFEKNSVLPVLSYLYRSENYEKFEEVLFQMDTFKISKELEHYLNFYVFLYKLKSYELSEEITEDDEYEIEELYHYFEQESCSREIFTAVKYVYSIFCLQIRKVKNFISSSSQLKFSLLANPRLYSKTRRLFTQSELITV